MEIIISALPCIATFFAAAVLGRAVMNAPVPSFFVSGRNTSRWFAASFAVLIMSTMFGYFIKPGPWVIVWATAAILGLGVSIVGTLHDRRTPPASPSLE